MTRPQKLEASDILFKCLKKMEEKYRTDPAYERYRLDPDFNGMYRAVGLGTHMDINSILGDYTCRERIGITTRNKREQEALVFNLIRGINDYARSTGALKTQEQINLDAALYMAERNMDHTHKIATIHGLATRNEGIVFSALFNGRGSLSARMAQLIEASPDDRKHDPFVPQILDFAQLATKDHTDIILKECERYVSPVTSGPASSPSDVHGSSVGSPSLAHRKL